MNRTEDAVTFEKKNGDDNELDTHYIYHDVPMKNDQSIACKLW